MGFNTIETPGIPGGDENQKIDGLYRYLVRMADELNIQLGKIGSNDLTDEERQVMMDVIRETSGPAGQEAEYLDGAAQMESLKSLIVKTAKFVQTKLQEYRTSLLRETVAEGQFGRYVRNTGLDVIVNPEGVTQNFTFREIVQGLRNFEIFSKNYIKTGLLRTEGGLPVYGLQIGKDIVTFSEDGEETYHDGNKAIEVLADAINFFSGGNKVFYINAGKIHSAGDLEIESGGKLKVKSGGTLDVDTTNFKINSTNKTLQTGNWTLNDTGLISDYGNSGKFEINRDGESMVFKFTNSSNKTVRLRFMNSNDPRSIYTPTMIYDMLYCTMIGDMTHKIMEASISTGYIDYMYGTVAGTSSREIKHDIKTLEEQGEKIDRLRPVSFVYDDDPEERTHNGLIYEEAIDVLPEICLDKNKDKAIMYIELIPVLLKEIQSLRQRVKQLEERGEN